MDKVIITLEKFRPKIIKDELNDFHIIVLYSQSEDHLFALNFIKNKSCGFNDYEMFEGILKMMINEVMVLDNCKVDCEYSNGNYNYEHDNNISWQNKEQTLKMVDDVVNKEFVIETFDDDLYGASSSNTNFKEFFALLIPYLKETYNLDVEFKEMMD